MSGEFWLLLGLDALFGIAIFAGRNWLKTTIEHSVQHHFDMKIEEVRTELRKSEEVFKSELRLKEAEIATLREGVLSGRTQRQVFLDKRRLDAVERLWTGLVALTPHQSISEFMSGLDVEEAAIKAPKDNKVRDLFKMLLSNLDPQALHNNPAKNERPFVSQLAWAYFFAYLTIVTIGVTFAKLLEAGVENVEDLYSKIQIKNLLKAALPHRSDFIDKNDLLAHHYLLDELQTSLLGELQKILRGEDQDAAAVAQAANIMEMTKEITAKMPERSSTV